MALLKCQQLTYNTEKGAGITHSEWAWQISLADKLPRCTSIYPSLHFPIKISKAYKTLLRHTGASNFTQKKLGVANAWRCICIQKSRCADLFMGESWEESWSSCCLSHYKWLPSLLKVWKQRLKTLASPSVLSLLPLPLFPLFLFKLSRGVCVCVHVCEWLNSCFSKCKWSHCGSQQDQCSIPPKFITRPHPQHRLSY